MKHFATPNFWQCYNILPRDVQLHADRSYKILKTNPNHPALQFKQIRGYWSVRIGLHYRALAVTENQEFVWFWIGSHADYDKLIG